MRPSAALAAGMVTVTASGLGTVLMETLMPFASGPVLVAPIEICPGQVVRSLVYSRLRVASVSVASSRLKVMTKLLDASSVADGGDGCAVHARVSSENPFEAVGDAVAVGIGIEGGGRAAYAPWVVVAQESKAERLWTSLMSLFGASNWS